MPNVSSARRLRATPWERYMAFDHGPRHTMTCFSRFWLSQRVERAAFVAAAVRVAGDNPLLAVQPRGAFWLPIAFDPDRQIEWDETAGPVTLRHQPPEDMLVRWTVRVGRLRDLGLAVEELAEEGLVESTGMLVVLRYPHAVADGLGAAAVMKQVCGMLSGRPLPPPTRDDLEGRPSLRRKPAWRRNLPQQLRRIALCFASRPSEFSPERPPVPDAHESEIACERIVASPAVTAALQAGARAARVSLNDVLLAALFRTLAPQMKSGSVIRIAVPVSLRGAGNHAFSNQVSMVFLDRTTGAATDAALLRGVSAEMTGIKRLKLGRAMHLGLGVVHHIGAGVLRGVTRLPLVWATAVLSNIGDVLSSTADAPGGIRVVAHDALPPLRPGTSLALLAVGHAGRLGLTLRFSPDRVSRQRARHVLETTLAEAAAVLSVERTST